MIVLGQKVGTAIVKMLGIGDEWKITSAAIDISKDNVSTINLSVVIETDTFKKLDAQLNADSK